MSARRRGLIGAALAVAGAIVLGVGLGAEAATPKRKATARKADDSTTVLVRLGKDGITRGDVQRRINSLPEQFRANYSTPEGRQQLLERMVEERVWLAEALKHGIADRPQVKEQIQSQRRDLLIRTYLNEVMASNPAPSDSEAKIYYEEHREDYKVPATMSIRHILSKTESESKRVRQWAKSNQDWAGLAKKYSADTLTRNNGGSLGTVTREGVFASIGAQPALAESAFKLADGQIGGPWKTDRGWHVVKMESKKEETYRPFDQVKAIITRQLGSQRSQDFYRKKLEEARRTMGVSPDSAAIKSFVSQKKSARDMFNEAQAAGTPEARIEAYRALLAAYPQSDVSPQAQFMIGFIQSEELKNYDQAEKSFRELLEKYPKAELAASAKWMIDHMRTEDAPAFIQLDADSLGGTAATSEEAAKAAGTKPKPKGGTKKP